MRHLLYLIALAILVAILQPGAAIPQEKPLARAIHVMTPNIWFLAINTDGSGSLQYGSGAFDNWRFKAGTFDVDKVTKELKGLAKNEKGGIRTHFVFHFESERKGENSPPATYTRDSKVIMALYEKAIEASPIKKQERGAKILEMYPPGLPKEN